MNVTYTYDQPASPFGVGRLTTLADAAGTLTRSYDERGNVLSETRVIGRGDESRHRYLRCRQSNRILTYPSGWTAVYGRDIMGR